MGFLQGCGSGWRLPGSPDSASEENRIRIRPQRKNFIRSLRTTGSGSEPKKMYLRYNYNYLWYYIKPVAYIKQKARFWLEFWIWLFCPETYPNFWRRKKQIRLRSFLQYGSESATLAPVMDYWHWQLGIRIRWEKYYGSVPQQLFLFFCIFVFEWFLASTIRIYRFEGWIPKNED